MARYRLNIRAEDDLANIGRYTQRMWGRSQRLKYGAAFKKAFQDLSEHPQRGANCNHIRSGYRKHSVEKHIVFYRIVDSDMIEIVRVLHQSMDLRQHMGQA